MEAKRLVSTKDMPREEWLSWRRKGIGGSDAAAILGLSQYSSAYSVWADKLGMLPERDETEALRCGRDLEAYVAERFEEISGRRTRNCNYLLAHHDHDFIIANVDRVIQGEQSLLECKVTSSYNLKKYKGGEFPEWFYPQVCHYLMVTGSTRAYLAVLVLNQALKVYMMTTLENDPVPAWCDGAVYVEPAELDALLQMEIDFWRHVETKEPPPVDGSEATRNAIDAINPPEDDKPAVLLYGMERIVEDQAGLKREKKRIDTALKEIDNRLRVALGGATTGLMHGYELRLSTITKQPYTVKGQTYTTLQVKEREEASA